MSNIFIILQIPSINVSLVVHSNLYIFACTRIFIFFIKIIRTFLTSKISTFQLSTDAVLLSVAPLKRNVRSYYEVVQDIVGSFLWNFKNTGEVIRRIPAIMNLPRKWKAVWTWQRIFDDSIVQYFVAALLNNLARDIGKGL